MSFDQGWAEHGRRSRARGRDVRGGDEWLAWMGSMGRGAFPPFGSPFGRGPRARRGDVRAAVLALLAEEPRNGYQLIQEIGRRSDEMWRPSPGSIYPALSLLEDEGLVRSREDGSRRIFELTDAGREYVAGHADELRSPWDQVTGGAPKEEWADLLGALKPIAMALTQIVSNGTERQVAQAAKVLAQTRRSLYQVLAEDDVPAD